MRMLWTFAKVAVALAIGVPLLLIALSMALGIFGALAALAFVVLRIAIVGLIIWGAIRVGISVFGGGSRRATPIEPQSLPPADPHYDAAMRELDRELGETSRTR